MSVSSIQGERISANSEPFKPEEKKEAAFTESPSHATANNQENINRVNADVALQPNIRAIKITPAPVRMEAYKRLACGDLEFEKEIYALEELQRFAALPNHDDFKKLSLRSQYLVAARHQWNLGFTGWTFTPAFAILESFDNKYKENENLPGIAQAIQQAIRIQEKILFMYAYKKSYVDANIVNVLDQNYDSKQIMNLDPQTYQQIQKSALVLFKARILAQMSESALSGLSIQKSVIKSSLLVLKSGYSHLASKDKGEDKNVSISSSK